MVPSASTTSLVLLGSPWQPEPVSRAVKTTLYFPDPV